MNIKISPTNISSKRTKNRIKENGPLFTAVSNDANHCLFNGKEAILVRSKSTNWLGWLPLNEIEVLHDNL